MSCQELQEEELEVLKSIYEGDDAFKEVSPITFQYKIGEDQHFKSFLLEINWGDDYPNELPNVNLDAFYNKHVLSDVKTSIADKLKEQAEDLLGCAMTYTLFDWAKENAEDLMKEQPDAPPSSHAECLETPAAKKTNDPAQPKQRKEQLTKAQKRKLYNRLDNKGEKPRGWDWVDVVKHLSQTGRYVQEQQNQEKKDS